MQTIVTDVRGVCPSVCHQCTEWHRWDSASLCWVIRCSLCQITLAYCYHFMCYQITGVCWSKATVIYYFRVTLWCRSDESESLTSAGVLRRQTSNTVLPPPRSLSFYDNLCLSEMLSDPQSELELILDDLRRNICALDAALSSPSPSTSSQCVFAHSFSLISLYVHILWIHFRPHRMHEIWPIAVEDPVARLSVSRGRLFLLIRQVAPLQCSSFHIEVVTCWIMMLISKYMCLSWYSRSPARSRTSD